MNRFLKRARGGFVDPLVESPRTKTVVRPFATRLACVLKAWVRQPSQVATIIPSSSQLIQRIADRPCVREARHVVELGPGAGGTTAGLLEQMRPDATLFALEKTAAFDDMLHSIDDPRLIIEIADALHLTRFLQKRGVDGVDVVVSGIPFSSIPPQVSRQIVKSIHDCLRPEGTFIAYQLHNTIQQYATPHFGAARCEKVVWNLPPLTVYTWQKQASTTT